MTNLLQHLNEQFAIEDHLHFKSGPGGLTVAEINNTTATATVALLGANVLSFQPHDERPVLWVSDHSRYEIGKAIRGGIPVAWPWFAGHPTDPSKPAHGFVRTALWSVSDTQPVSDGETRLRLELTDTSESRALWPYAFQLDLIITVGATLQVALVIRNPGQSSFSCGGALHSYFSVSDVTKISVEGLHGCTYLDKVAGDAQKIQHGPVTVEGETDRIYLDTTATCVIEDPGWNRQIHISKAGSYSTVIWNPWIEKSRRLADFGDDEYSRMICVETTNAATDVVNLVPGETHRLLTAISLKS